MNILIVDDSVVFRMAIANSLESVEGVNVVGSASNGKIAIEFLEKNTHPDVVILDMEMPVMGGIDTIKAIRNLSKDIVIICFSALTSAGAELTLKALSLGANDIVTKQEASSNTIDGSMKMIESILVPKLIAFKTKSTKRSLKTSTDVAVNQSSLELSDYVSDINISPELILIASSTGGPEALSKIFKGIEVKPKIPILLVQHMPPIFTKSLANMLNNLCPFIEIKEAENGDILESGKCYIAPGDYHMLLNKNLTLSLTQTEKVSYVRPSATVTFNSVVKNFPKKTISFILTGMGDDGARGVQDLYERGDYLYVQDENSSVVWGMPAAAKQTCPNVKEIDILQVPLFINQILAKRNLKN